MAVLRLSSHGASRVRCPICGWNTTRVRHDDGGFGRCPKAVHLTEGPKLVLTVSARAHQADRIARESEKRRQQAQQDLRRGER